MFGRVRASPATSLELLEFQRSSCKIIKHDSLSIYESTLLKLKQGSRRNPRCHTEDSASTDVMEIDSSEAMTAVTGSPTQSHPTSSSSVPSTTSSNDEASTNMSILHFFSKQKSVATQIHDSSEEEPMATESGYSSSCSVCSS